MTSVLKSVHNVSTTTRKFIASATSSMPQVRKLSENELGANYNTGWARTTPATIVRAIMVNTLTKGFVQFLAAPKTHGAGHLVDVEGPAIFAANHASHLDTSLLITQLPSRFRNRSIVAAAADYFFDRQWKAALWALWLNIIPIEREKVGRRSADLAARLIGEGYNLVIFPEGTRSRDGGIAKFRGGAAYLGIKCAVPVVPVYIEGTRDIWRAGRGSIRRGQATVYFGQPLTPLPDERSREFNDRIENTVRAMAAHNAVD